MRSIYFACSVAVTSSTDAHVICNFTLLNRQLISTLPRMLDTFRLHARTDDFESIVQRGFGTNQQAY